MADAPSARDRLDDALGATAPDPVRALPDDVLDRLVAVIEAGRRHHLRVAEQATEKALKGVPLPVRAIVRTALT
jgi:hypothetical protein